MCVCRCSNACVSYAVCLVCVSVSVCRCVVLAGLCAAPSRLCSVCVRARGRVVCQCVCVCVPYGLIVFTDCDDLKYNPFARGHYHPEFEKKSNKKIN